MIDLIIVIICTIAKIRQYIYVDIDILVYIYAYIYIYYMQSHATCDVYIYIDIYKHDKICFSWMRRLPLSARRRRTRKGKLW